MNLQVPYYFTWITDCYRIGWDVASNHRSSSNGHVVANAHDVRIFYGYIENVSSGDTLRVNAASIANNTFWTIYE